MPIIINREVKFISLLEIREKTGYELKIINNPDFEDDLEIYQVLSFQRDKNNNVMYVKLIDQTGMNMPYKEIIYTAKEFFEDLFGISINTITEVEIDIDDNDEDAIRVEIRK